MKLKLVFIGTCMLIITIVTVLSFSKDKYDQTKNAVNVQNESNVQVTPKSQIKGEVEVYDFEDAVNISDLIAEIVINKKIKELDEPSPKTLYEATIKKAYKDAEKHQDIRILQQGNSQWLFNENKLFSEKEEYILFLKKAVGEEFEGTNTYWILGEETNMYSVIDTGKIKKHSFYEDDLMDIEDKNLTKILKEKEKNNKDIQVLDKNKFEKKIIEIVDRQKKNK
ncbi:hypothetical protein [Bacillus sp. 165]|uniref:hypothetical protein n=1 Tax=Bacillus sp. 165 TaxID=1529117 RepID=UPI001ADABD30|nr:hypothetical protein [Bacillus sp. 165]MBO9129454.1 hypothetical protein [Bacillus sp. 165]